MTLARLVGDDIAVGCLDGSERVYLGLDAGASTPALEAVAARVQEFLPWYSSVHRGAGAKSQVSTEAYENARAAMLRFAGRDPSTDVAILCRNTTEAINILAYRLDLSAGDTVVTTVAEHHANLLPWQRLAHERGVRVVYVECGPSGTFAPDEVAAAVEAADSLRLVAITGATNVTGWMPDVATITAHAHLHGAQVLVDAAQLAPHRPLGRDAAVATPDFVAWSGHKMYAPFGTGVLVGPRATFEHGAPLLVGGGAVNLVDLDDVLWTDPPEREEAGSPNVIGAVALHAAVETYEAIGWDAIVAHEVELADRLRRGLAATRGVRLLGPTPGDSAVDARMLAVATFAVEGMAHSLVAARLSAEDAIGVRHGCFCAHPYLVRLLGLSDAETARYRHDIVAGDRRNIPGAVRASASISTTIADVDRFLAAVADLAGGRPEPVPYVQDPTTGDYRPTSVSATSGP